MSKEYCTVVVELGLEVVVLVVTVLGLVVVGLVCRIGVVVGCCTGDEVCFPGTGTQTQSESYCCWKCGAKK